MRGLGDTQWVPLSQTPQATAAQAQAACQAASGTWSSGGIFTNPGCTLNIGASLPSYCNYSFMQSLLPSECALPANTADLAAYGNYTAYMTGINQAAGMSTNTLPNGTTAPTEQDLVNQNTQQSTSLLANPTGCDLTTPACVEANCEYNAAANYPTLSQIMSPAAVCAFTNNSWIMYAGLAVVGLLLFGAMKK